MNKIKRNAIVPTQLQKDLITGSLLGDGMIANPIVPGNSYYQENHCLSQEEYLIFKSNILLNLVSSVKHNFNKVSELIGGNKTKIPIGSKRKRVVLRSISHPFFSSLEKVWYKRDINWKHMLDRHGRRIKIIPNDIEINPFSVAMWYCDDGTHYPERKVCNFATCGFRYEETEFLVEKLKDLSINAFVAIKDRMPFIFIRTNSYLDFINMISPHVATIECMAYKIDLSKYKVPLKQKISQEDINYVLLLSETTDMTIAEIGKHSKVGAQNASQILRRYKNCCQEKSKTKGVRWNSDGGKWTATIYGVADKKAIHLGSFDNKEKAEEIVIKANNLKKQGIDDVLQYKNI